MDNQHRRTRWQGILRDSELIVRGRIKVDMRIADLMVGWVEVDTVPAPTIRLVSLLIIRK